MTDATRRTKGDALAPTCSCSETHEPALASARAAELPVGTLLGLADLFKVLGDPTRLRIVNALAAAGELCVCDLSAALSLSQSAVSHQLAVLRRSRLARPRRDGKTVFYALDDEHVRALLALGLEHAREGSL
ncbi:MAG TPA: metalloregulator ArsR/SmtB family transcription factor [Spirochaetales bacterium]|nr:metalloregulator ArsR/SmtB family transcription factor [Spirochaetales bacterium]